VSDVRCQDQSPDAFSITRFPNVFEQDFQTEITADLDLTRPRRSRVPHATFLVRTLAPGCGNPTALAELKPGQIVLDLGSGGGIDVLLFARRCAPGFIRKFVAYVDEPTF
jgi:hypothetical protein